MKTRLLSFVLISFTAGAARAQLTLNQIGGTIGGGNYGTAAGTTAFGLDEIGGGSIPIHKIPNVRDGLFGNPNSWIGDSLNSYVGLTFGSTVSVGRVAWGRDNTGTFADRTAGLYTVHYTQVSGGGSSLAVTGDPTTGWAVAGSVNYVSNGVVGSPLSMSLRHEWGFAAVQATAIRLTVPGSSFADGGAIDELEAYAPSAPALTLVTTGGTMDAATNLGLTSTAFAKDLLGGGAFAPTHTIGGLNDGVYGNANSWIGDSEASFAGLNFNGSYAIQGVAFGRDNTGNFGDRAAGTYLLQYTNVASPGAGTADSDWTTLGSIYYDAAGLDTADRHEYSFAPVTATGLRLMVSGNGMDGGIAIDELEVYAVPEPGVGVLALAAAGMVAGRRRRVG